MNQSLFSLIAISHSHEGGAETPTDRCPLVNYTDGVFRCGCCGRPLFFAKNKYDAQVMLLLNKTSTTLELIFMTQPSHA